MSAIGLDLWQWVEELEEATCTCELSRAGASMVRGLFLDMHRAAREGDGAAVAQLGRMVLGRPVAKPVAELGTRPALAVQRGAMRLGLFLSSVARV